jgi:CO/xanthine dehydrogenase FAD-binding subunit
VYLFDSIRPRSFQDVYDALSQNPGKSAVIAGGTDMLVQFHMGDRRWEQLDLIVDLTALRDELRFVRDEGDTLLIGALSTHTDLERNPIILEHLKFLADACHTVGSVQIRNLGTIGGSVCNASPAADPLTPLVAAEAEVIIYNPNGEHAMPILEFFVKNGVVKLEPGEFVTGFRVKKPATTVKTGFAKLGRRKALAIARLNTAVMLDFDEHGKISFARLSPGAVFAVPDRVERAEQILLGEKPSEKAFMEAGRIVSETMVEQTGRRWSTPYKEPVVEVIVADALCHATGMEIF